MILRRLLALTATTVCLGADAVLRLSVVDSEERPLKGVVLTPRGGGSASNPTDNSGSTELRYSYGTARPYKLDLQVKLPPDLYFISPYDQRVTIPDCELRDSNCYESVKLGRRQKKLAKADLAAIAGSVVSVPEKLPPPPDPKQPGLTEIAGQLGIAAGELDAQLTDWANTSPKTVESLLYRGRFDGAEQILSRQTPSAKTYDQLAVAQYYQSKLPESASSAAKVVALRPWDAAALNKWGVVLEKAEEPAGARAAFRTARAEVATTDVTRPQERRSWYERLVRDIMSLETPGIVADRRPWFLRLPAVLTERFPGVVENASGLWRWAAILVALVFWVAVGWAAWHAALFVWGAISTFRRRRAVPERRVDIDTWREGLRRGENPGWGQTGDSGLVFQHGYQYADSPFPELPADICIEVGRSARRKRIYLIGAIVLCLGAAGGAAFFLMRKPAPRAKHLVTIGGGVFDVSGSPVGGAQVKVLGTDSGTSTGLDGEFRIERADAGDIVLRASKEGYEPGVDWWSPGNPARRVRLTLRALEAVRTVEGIK